MTQALNVEYQELMARADEIEQPLPTIPSTNPSGPCGLSFINDAAAQIALNADSMRLYLKACEREWKALAESLRNAAKAYEEVDEEGADAIDGVEMGSGSSASGGTARPAGGKTMADSDLDAPLLTETASVGSYSYPYYEVRQAAQDIEAGDQGTAFRAFAAEWDAFQRTFQQKTIERFRPFVSWEGDARAAVETNFDQQRQWIISMVTLCTQLASQANLVVDAHKKATAREGYHDQHSVDTSHPTTYEVSQCDYWYKRYTSPGYQWSQYVYLAIEWYERMQAKSEEVLAQYKTNAQLPLQPVTPQRVPSATRIDLPNIDPNNPNNPFDPYNPFDPSNPFNDPSSTQTPMVPTVPSTTMPMSPSTPDTGAKLDQALKDLKGGLPKGAGGVKPASLGGGGAPGIPKMPLEGAEGGAAARPAGAGPGSAAAGLGRGLRGAMGGGMGGGMAPMGAGQGQQNAGKGKRLQSEDDALYTEEREWTEGVVGNRPRKAAGPGPGPDK